MLTDVERISDEQRKTRAVLYCVIGALAVAVCIYVATRKGGVASVIGDVPGIIPKAPAIKVPKVPAAAPILAAAPIPIAGAA